MGVAKATQARRSEALPMGAPSSKKQTHDLGERLWAQGERSALCMGGDVGRAGQSASHTVGDGRSSRHVTEPMSEGDRDERGASEVRITAPQLHGELRRPG